jgi:hypothetical protein
MSELVWHLRQQALPAALALLPGQMDTPEARAMLFAIGYQESEFLYRRQLGNGPARGFWQFERMGGVKEILDHAVVGPMIKQVCKTLIIAPTPAACHEAMQFNDVLAACFARLLLYVDPAVLPGRTGGSALGWKIYLRNWRPGKPGPLRWPRNFKRGWQVVEGDVNAYS